MDRRRAFFVLALLSLAAYAPALSIPFLEDDYPLISLADQTGPWGVLTNPVFRVRATMNWEIQFLRWVFPLLPFVYHAVSLLVHFANTWLVYRIALEWPRMRPAAFWAAAFFAVAEGHQEAVMWFAAMSELLQFLFGALALLCWMRGRAVAAAIWFGLALLSKESAIIWLPLFALTAPPGDWRRTFRRMLPELALAAVAVVAIASTQRYNFRFSDGSFSLQAPFITTWVRNVGRVLWIWGWIAVAVSAWKFRDLSCSLLLPILWVGAGLLPYCFLTYSQQIPSRQTYLASAGLALVVGLVFDRIHKHRLAGLLGATILLHNLGILWVKKRAQFIARAEPTEQLIRLARSTNGPIWMRCFPRPGLIATEAVRLAAGRPAEILVWNETEIAQKRPEIEYCFREP